jgi:hypothetical protein
MPSGTTFQQVYSINLISSLTEGDCGSPVFEASNEKLFGHIVAGCRSNGFAYVMAAEQVVSKLRVTTETVSHTTDTADTVVPSTNEAFKDNYHHIPSNVATPQANREDSASTSISWFAKEPSSEIGAINSANPKHSESFGFSTADVASLVGISARIRTMLHSRIYADLDQV